MIFVRDVFRCLAVVDQRVKLRHALVGKAPAERAVVHLHIATLVRVGRLTHDPRTAGHALDAAGNKKITVIGFHGASRLIDRFEARAAQAIDRRAGNCVRQAGKQRRVACDVARVFARLIGAAEVDVFDLFFIDAGLFDELRNDKRGEIVGANVFENAAVAAHRCAHGFNDNGFSHGFT